MIPVAQCWPPAKACAHPLQHWPQVHGCQGGSGRPPVPTKDIHLHPQKLLPWAWAYYVAAQVPAS